MSKGTVALADSETNKLEKHNLKKHTALVHCSNTLTLLQRKISNALLYHAYEKLLDEEEHQIRIGELCDLIGYKGHNYDAVKDAFKELISTVVEWNLIDKETNEEDWTASSILSSVNLKSSVCTYSYSHRMKQLLKTPAMYAKINLFVQTHFRSSYGLALYENCIRYQDLPSTGWFEIDLFRKMMGVPKDAYKVFKDFKKRVIDNAIHEVNSFSMIFIEPEYEKHGRTVKRIRFLIRSRQIKRFLGKVNNLEETFNNDFGSLKVRLKLEFSIKESVVEQLCLKYPYEYILEKIELIEQSKQFRVGKIKNLGGLLIKALEDDFKATTPQSLLKLKADRKTASDKKDSDNLNMRTKFENLRQQQIIEKFSAYDKPKSEVILNEFESYLGASLPSISYKRAGLQDYIVAREFAKFIIQNYSDFLSDLTTYESFIKTQELPA